MKEVYENYELHANAPSREELKSISRTYSKIFGEFLPKDKQSKILDIGCGYGAFIYFLKNKGYKKYWGIDLSKEEINFCKKNISNNVSVENIFNFLKKNKDYDLIVANHLMEHLPKKELLEMLIEIRKSLGKNGKLMLQVPNTSNPFSLSSRYIDITHEIGFTQNSLLEILRVARFKEVKINGILSEGSLKAQIRNFVSRKMMYPLTKLAFVLQGFGAPKYLEPKLIGVAEK